MVKAYIRWPRVHRLPRPGAWCHRVLVNACNGWWRRQQIERKYAYRFAVSDGMGVDADPEVVDFWHAVRRLPTRQRAVVTLVYVGQYTTVEVATILAVPEGTVRSDLSRSRDWLAHELRLS
jgi:RNA polymerase sigma-70 factor (ECF subfamily)